MRFAAWAIVFVCVFCCLADEVELQLEPVSTLMNRLRAGEVPPKQRQQAIESLFEQAGCKATLERVDRHYSNVVCDLPGKRPATIVVGAHYDFAGEGQGIVDDWSGTALLASLFQTVKAAHPQHQYEFVAFAGEEKGLAGSSRFVKDLSVEQKAAIRAFVNVECLGLATPKIWMDRSNRMLVQRWEETASAVHTPMSGVNVGQLSDDDSHPFQLQNIPVISIHSLTQQTFSILHSKRDNMEVIHPDAYYDSYRVLALYLTYLDEELSN